MAEEKRSSTQVVVVGAGIIGLMNALGLAKRGLKVTIIDNIVGQKRSFKVGESLLIFSNMFLRSIGGLDKFNQESFPKHGVWFTYGMEHKKSFENTAEWGLETTAPDEVREGFENPAMARAFLNDVQIVRPEAEDELANQARANPNITFLDTASVNDIVIDKAGGDHTVKWRCKATAATGIVSAKWVIDCSGRNRMLAKRLGHACEDKVLEEDGFRTTAVWGQFGGVDDAMFEAYTHAFDNGYETRRDLSTLHLWGDGYWIWVIRLSGGRISVGATFDQRAAPAGKNFKEQFWTIMRRYPIFDEILREDNVLELRTFKHVQHLTDTFVNENRYGMVGDAGSIIDAYYSQGMSLAFVTSWHIANIVSRDLQSKELDKAYIDRVNEHTFADWLFMRNMVVEKYTPAIKDGRFFIMTHLLDSVVLGAVEPRFQLARWLVETGGDPKKETPVLTAFRENLEQKLFYSACFPWNLTTPAKAHRLQRRLQVGLGERARWRIENGVEVGPIRCLMRPFGAGPLRFWKMLQRSRRFMDISGKSLKKIPSFMKLTGKEESLGALAIGVPVVFAIFMILYSYDVVDTLIAKLFVGLGLMGKKRVAEPALVESSVVEAVPVPTSSGTRLIGQTVEAAPLPVEVDGLTQGAAAKATPSTQLRAAAG